MYDVSNIWIIRCFRANFGQAKRLFKQPKFTISRVENGKADIQISTLVKLFTGLGRRVSVRII